jgi:hypothetical protein
MSDGDRLPIEEYYPEGGTPPSYSECLQTLRMESYEMREHQRLLVNAHCRDTPYAEAIRRAFVIDAVVDMLETITFDTAGFKSFMQQARRKRAGYDKKWG